MGEWLVPEPHGSFVPHAGNSRPALSRKMAGQWCCLEHARVSGGIPLQAQCSHGPAECLPRLVVGFEAD
jgi:hypothetical protein